MKEIYLAGGCFWGLEKYFRLIHGVSATRVGYANGDATIKNPTYQQVCTDMTGFAETVHVTYDPAIVSLDFLLGMYFLAIDPTSVNRQGEDEGTQYRTGIYYTADEDLPIIEAKFDETAKRYYKPLAVEVKPLANFFNAEEYHQLYLDKNPNGYCHLPLELFELARKARQR